MLRDKIIEFFNFSRVGEAAGIIMAVAILLITMITTIGAITITASSMKLKETETTYQDEADFYIAESGWKEGVLWLEAMADPPFIKNAKNNLVHEYGDGDPDALKYDFNGNAKSSEALKDRDIAYRCEVEYLGNKVNPGSGESYRRFYYLINSKAGQSQEIDVVLSRLFKVGY